MLLAGLIAAALIAPKAPERMRSAFLYPLTDGVGIAAGNGRVYVTQSAGPVKTFGVLFE